MLKRADPREPKYSRREAEVVDILFRRQESTARDVWTVPGEVRTYSTVRKHLSILEEKGENLFDQELQRIFDPPNSMSRRLIPQAKG